MSKQTLSALANHGQTTIHTSPAISNTTGQGQTTSSTLNALIFEHSMGGINIATALPKQTYGKTNITDTSNMQPTKFSMNKAKLTPFETQLLAQAKAAAEKKAEQDVAKQGDTMAESTQESSEETQPEQTLFENIPAFGLITGAGLILVMILSIFWLKK